MNQFVVVDASLAVKWLVNETHTDQAFVLARRWVGSDTQPVAPYLMPVEVANALNKRISRRELSLESAVRLMGSLLVSGIQFREPVDLNVRALELAVQLEQSAVYDAHYLALAVTLDCGLWTADERFYRSAKVSYPRIHWIGEA